MKPFYADPLFYKHYLYSLSGLVLPFLATLITLPFYLRAIGTDRYGFISLILIIIAYFELLDLGLSRASINRLSQILKDNKAAFDAIFSSVALVNLGLGLLSSTLFFLSVSFIISTQKMSADLTQEFVHSIWITCPVIPINMMITLFNGRMDAQERFLAVNMVQIAGVVTTQLMPIIAVTVFSSSLASAFSGLLIARAAYLAILWLLSSVPLAAFSKVSFSRFEMKALFHYGSWVTVSNLISPIFVGLDQFYIGHSIGVGDLAIYSIPLMIVGRILILSGALSRVFFPKLSKMDRHRAHQESLDALNAFAWVFGAVCCVMIATCHMFFNAWIGPEFASKSKGIGEILFIGAWFNAMAGIPYIFFQSRAKAHLIAIFHLIEILPYLAILIVGAHYFGFLGVAFAWTSRTALDAALLIGFFKIGKRDALNLTAVFLMLLATYYVFVWDIIAGLASIALFISTIIILLTLYLWFGFPKLARVV